MPQLEARESAPKARLTREDRREIAAARFLDAASRIVCDEGISALTLQRLADEAGSAIGAVYRYFPSKDAVLVALQARAFGKLLDELGAFERQVDRSAHSAEVRALTMVLAMARHYQALPERDPAAFALFVQLLGTTRILLPKEQFSEVMVQAQRVFDLIAARLDHAACMHALSPGPKALRAMVFFSAVHGVLQLRKLSRFDVQAPSGAELDREVVDTLLVGWGACVSNLQEAHRALRQVRTT